MKIFVLCTGRILCTALLCAAMPVGLAADTATEQLLSKARSLEGRGRPDLAARVWEQTLLADPNNAEALLGLAKFEKQSGKIEEANRHIETLRSMDPKNPSIGTVEGMTTSGKQRSALEEATRLAANQNFEGAMRIYRALFGNEPPPGGIAIGYYETQAATPGGWKDAVAAMERLANRYPQSEEYRFSLGRLKTYRETSRVEGMDILAGIKGDTQLVKKAGAAWRQALVWSAGNAMASSSLEAYLSRYPDPELQKLVVHTPKNVEAVKSQPANLDNAESGKGYSLLNAQKLAEAEKHFQAALKITPRDGSALAGLGYTRMKKQDFPAAINFFRQSLEVQPKNKTVVEALATARYSEQMKTGGDGMNRKTPDVAVDHFQRALAMRPNSGEATEALAGAYMLAQQPALAVPLYEKLTQLKRQNLEYWYGLVKAKYQSGAGSDALTDVKNAPSQVKAEWAKNPEYIALLSFIYADLGAPDQSKQMFERAVAAASSTKTELPIYQQLQFAGLSVRAGRSSQAADAFLQIAAKHPYNVDAWTGAISALVQVPDSTRAYEVLQRIPPKAYATAETKADFLRSVARLQTLMKRWDLAEGSLNEAARIDSEAGKQPDLDSRLQLADLAVRLQRTEEAERLLRGIAEEFPNDRRAWSSLIGLLHESKADAAALVLIETMPEKVAVEMQSDAGFVALEASVYLSAGQKERALSLVRNAQKRFGTTGHGAPASLDIQLAWLLLNSEDDQPEVSRIIERDTNRADLTAMERHDLNQVRSVWSQRRAQAAIQDNDYRKAISILQGASTLMPQDPQIQAMLASTFLRAENFEKAFDVYQKWDLKGAAVDDFRGAVGAASAMKKDKVAAKWLDRGLTEHPGNPRLLQLAGEQAARHRDYKLADAYFREAISKLSSEGVAPSKEDLGSAEPAARQTPNSSDAISGSTLLDTKTDSGSGAISSLTPPAVDVLSVEPQAAKPEPISDLRFGAPEARLKATRNVSAAAINLFSNGARAVPVSMPVSLATDPVPADRSFAEGSDSDSRPSEREVSKPESASVTLKVDAQPELLQQLQDEQEAVNARNTPYFQNGVNLQERTGQGGFDKLLVEEAHLEASTTVADHTRFTLIAAPTYADSGAPASSNDNGHLGFGTTAINGVPNLRTAFGIAGEAQLATTNFGLRVGLTPYEFLVHSWVGGIRWNPAGGPLTFLVDRDAVRDTMLSFAGERDPTSQRVWGGVMANTAAVKGNWAHGNTGYYAKLDYQDIEGKSVEKNSRVEVNVGSYFKVYHNKQGELTAGLNLTGMHYDQNLRYFTLGQGGYFSPQQYFLFNIPVQWTGNVNQNLQYSISASLGLQHFTEDRSPYFPTDSALQAASGANFYPSYTNTGGNYNLGFRSIYQITPQWLGGAFFDVNNAREYRSVSAGIYLKYLVKPRPASTGLGLTAVPDWQGVSPFDLH